MANIRDIAKLAGVSVTTVSRVLNGHPYVSEEKRQAVLRAMAENDYHRNMNAVHLSKGKTMLIGVVVPYMNHPYFGLLVEGISNEAVKHHHKLVLIQTNYEKDREFEALAMLQFKQIDALIICSRISSWETIEAFLQYGPIVLCEDARGRKVSSTFINHDESFTRALSYLHSKGYKKIGYCIGRLTGTNSIQREKAYRRFLQETNQPYIEDYVFHGCLSFEDGERVVAQLRQMEQPPEALLVTSDIVAAGILTCCREQEIDVPGRLALIGFDNQPISRIMHITTLEIPLIDIGRKLFLQAVSETGFSHEEVSTRLIERLTV